MCRNVNTILYSKKKKFVQWYVAAPNRPSVNSHGRVCCQFNVYDEIYKGICATLDLTIVLNNISYTKQHHRHYISKMKVGKHFTFLE